MSSQKLELLKMSLENRLTEFPHLVDSSDTAEVSIPRPAQLTGTLTLKLLGCEGLVDITHLRSIISVPISFNHRPSTGNLLHMMDAASDSQGKLIFLITCSWRPGNRKGRIQSAWCV